MILKTFSLLLFVIVLLPLQVSAQQYKVVMTESDTTTFDVQDDATEYQILAELFAATNGKRWTKKTNWLSGTTSEDMARWHGIVMKDGDVSEIHLPSNNLKGKVPASLYKLLRLSAVSFEGNDLENQELVDPSSQGTSGDLVQFSTLSELQFPEPLVAGKNLPVWGLAVAGVNARHQSVDWRKYPPEVSSLSQSGASQLGATGVAIDNCGRLAFYVLHSGIDKPYQLHIYDPTGVRLTTESFGPNQALNSVHGNVELQVVRVPGKADEWFIIYSLFERICPVSPPGSIYCPARVVYTRVRYNTSGLYIFPDRREVSISDKTFTQGKAVSRTVNGQTTGHYLYLAERTNSGEDTHYTRVHRYIIDESGINFGSTSIERIPARYWIGGIAGSSVELSPDEKTVAISNRNVGFGTTQDIILFDLANFNTPGYQPKIISIPDLKMAETGMTVRQFYLTYPQYSCLKYMKNKLSFIEFSPSGRYLYAVHGGYVENSAGVTYNSYLLQIDLQDLKVRVQVEQGVGVDDGPDCVGATANATNNFTEQIQSAYDGKLYFTKRNSSNLFVIPNPDDLMPHDLTPGVINLQPSGNIVMAGDAKVVYMPENIDGYNYLSSSPNAAFSLAPLPAKPLDQVTLTVQNPVAQFRYQVAWGNGTNNSLTLPGSFQIPVTLTTNYAYPGSYPVTLTVVDNAGCASASTASAEILDCGDMENLPITATQYLCATKFSIPKISDCYATYQWDFGDGQTSTARSPMHVYQTSGQRHVTVNVTYNCGACGGVRTFSTDINISKNTGVQEIRTIQVSTDRKPMVITSAATTFSDVWPLDHCEPGLENMNKFISGSHGVWRNEGVHLYNTTRLVSPNVDLSVDGTYTLEIFNWPLAHLSAIPKWIKTNTITRYNASSYETENVDVLGISSAALYDFRGELQSAHGVNMRNEEMGFTGFEDPQPVASNYIMSKPTGNFIFNTDPVPAYVQYSVVSAESYVAIVNVPLADIQDAEKVDVAARSFTGSGPFSFESNYLQDVRILCKESHPTASEWSVLVLERAPHDGMWWGEIRIKSKISPAGQGVIDFAKSHTGSSSLKISADKTFEQKLIRLQAGKTYHLNAWVAVLNSNVSIPKLADGLGVDVELRNKQGVKVTTTFIVPQGNIIEGWQQVRGSFVCPESDLTLSLKFKAGSTGQAWYDDIRLHPDNGNMKSYVYDIANYRLQAVLDEENFASFFYYDKEGNLFLTKKETEEGIKTITENISYNVEQQPE